jgi:prepilin-type N-terminal cleavage/methylation domain-containing protein
MDCKASRNERGFTLVEVLAVLIIVAILAGVGTPIYLSYVEGARAAEAQTTISSIVSAEKIFYQKHGRYATLEELTTKKKHLNLDPATEINWKFEITATETELKKVTAMSTEDMPGGAGKSVEFDAQTGKFTGYGQD